MRHPIVVVEDVEEDVIVRVDEARRDHTAGLKNGYARMLRLALGSRSDAGEERPVDHHLAVERLTRRDHVPMQNVGSGNRAAAGADARAGRGATARTGARTGTRTRAVGRGDNGATGCECEAGDDGGERPVRLRHSVKDSMIAGHATGTEPEVSLERARHAASAIFSTTASPIRDNCGDAPCRLRSHRVRPCHRVLDRFCRGRPTVGRDGRRRRKLNQWQWQWRRDVRGHGRAIGRRQRRLVELGRRAHHVLVVGRGVHGLHRDELP